MGQRVLQECWGSAGAVPTDEIWKAAKEEAMEKVKEKANRRVGTDALMVNEAEVEKSF